jgi:hypothetical protein
MRTLLVLLVIVGCSSHGPPPTTPAPAPSAPADAGPVTIDAGIDADMSMSTGPPSAGTGVVSRGGTLPPRIRIPKPTVRVGRLLVTGPLDSTVVRRTLREKLSTMQACGTADLAGTVQISFTIDRNGKTHEVSASGLPAVESCMVEVIRALPFPAPIERTPRVEVQVPITFGPAAP